MQDAEECIAEVQAEVEEDEQHICRRDWCVGKRIRLLSGATDVEMRWETDGALFIQETVATAQD